MVKAKEMNQINRYFPNKEMANKYEKKKKKSSLSLAIRETHIKTTLRFCYPNQNAILKKRTHAGEDVRKTAFMYCWWTTIHYGN